MESQGNHFIQKEAVDLMLKITTSKQEFTELKIEIATYLQASGKIHK
ncbi:hypothetical protein [Enterococcus sp. 2201sp1_2201st1_C11_2201SCRN_220225]